MSQYCCKVFSVGLFLLASSSVWSATNTSQRLVGDPEAMLGPKSSARGASTNGSHLVHDSMFLNPAAAATEKSYTVTVGYTPMGDQLSASVIDTKSSEIGGGVYYVRRDLRDLTASPLVLGNYRRIEDRTAVSFFGMIDESIAIGALGKYTFQKSFDPQYENSKNWNGDFGIKYIFNRSFQVGFAGQNILKDDIGLNPKSFALGIESLPVDSINISARVIYYPSPGSTAQYRYTNNDSQVGFSVGTEYAFVRGFVARAGYKDQPTWDEKVASAGLGYSAKEWGLDYSFQIATTGTKANAHMATLFGRF